MHRAESRVNIDEATIRTLRGGEAKLVGDVIADSHADYPSFAHLFPEPRRRVEVLRSLMSGVARDARRFGEVRVAVVGNRMLGVAVWLPPGRFPWSSVRKLRAVRAFLPVLWHGRGSASKLFAVGRNAERAAPGEPHWYLVVLGIRREAQGHGLATRLIEPALARADEEGKVSYLETANRANLAFYERFGFEFDRRLQLIPDGPPHFSMRRPPQIPHSVAHEGAS